MVPMLIVSKREVLPRRVGAHRRFDRPRDVLVRHRSIDGVGSLVATRRVLYRVCDGREYSHRRSIRRILRVRAVRRLHGEMSVARRFGDEYFLRVDVEDQLARRAQAWQRPEVEVLIRERADGADGHTVDHVEVVAARPQQLSGHFAAGTLPTSSMFSPPGSLTNTFRTVGLQVTSSPFFDTTRTPLAFIRASRSPIAATRIAIPDDPGSGTRKENG